jgi:glutamyl-tRNA synthetase
MSVRVRIAPSPTGDPHVGTAYIALMNCCFARSQGGSFVLRIEDTDRTRYNADSERFIMESLAWLGLVPDESPQAGGPFGPYRQSERHAEGLYRRYADQLVTQGDAYPCFCDGERLAGLREQGIFGYDRHCRDLDPEAAAARVAAGEEHVIRMKAPLEGDFTWPDRLRKRDLEMPWADVDDQILLKSDGWPTYHLAAVVDDHLMQISHVIRAEEWLKSLPKHIWLNQRLGFTPPEYLHVGLLRNADKSKISKRKNPTNLLWYRQRGFLPQALVNFLCLLGHGHPEGKERFDLDEMVRVFELDRLGATGPVFDLAKLHHLQGEWFRALDDTAMTTAIHEALDQRLPALLPLLRDRMAFGGDICQQADIFFRDLVEPRAEDLVPKGWDAAQSRAALQGFVKAVKQAAKDGEPDWSAVALESLIRSHGESQAYKPKQFFMLLRVAICGRTASPPLFETMAEVGRLTCQQRLEQALLALGG